jgi:hypothetical protein
MTIITTTIITCRVKVCILVCTMPVAAAPLGCWALVGAVTVAIAACCAPLRIERVQLLLLDLSTDAALFPCEEYATVAVVHLMYVASARRACGPIILKAPSDYATRAESVAAAIQNRICIGIEAHAARVGVRRLCCVPGTGGNQGSAPSPQIAHAALARLLRRLAGHGALLEAIQRDRVTAKLEL